MLVTGDTYRHHDYLHDLHGQFKKLPDGTKGWWFELKLAQEVRGACMVSIAPIYVVGHATTNAEHSH